MQPESQITGGTGLLGKKLSHLLDEKAIPHHVASRTNNLGLSNWVPIDLENGSGIEAAVRGKKTVFHLASATQKPSATVDVDGTVRLLEAAHKAGVSHILLISIVGIDKVPIEYYKIKWMTEKAVAAGSVPFTILRSTQFHDFGDFMLSKVLKYPVGLLPKYANFQPIEISAVANHLFELSTALPKNQIINIGGPQVWPLSDLVATWLKARKQQKLLINLPPFNRPLRALRDGALTCKETSLLSIGWTEWLDKKYR